MFILSFLFKNFELIARRPQLKSRVETFLRGNQRLELESFGRIREAWNRVPDNLVAVKKHVEFVGTFIQLPRLHFQLAHPG
jgi:hypothetical protein